MRPLFVFLKNCNSDENHSNEVSPSERVNYFQPSPNLEKKINSNYDNSDYFKDLDQSHSDSSRVNVLSSDAKANDSVKTLNQMGQSFKSNSFEIPNNKIKNADSRTLINDAIENEHCNNPEINAIQNPNNNVFEKREISDFHKIPSLLSSELMIRSRPIFHPPFNQSYLRPTHTYTPAKIRFMLNRPSRYLVRAPPSLILNEPREHSLHGIQRHGTQSTAPLCDSHSMNDGELNFIKKLNYEHIEKEDFPTRVLFISNIDPNVMGNDLYYSFGEYGVIEQINIKRQILNHKLYVNAFIYYKTLDMAVKAITQLSFSLEIGGNKYPINYGKSTPSNTIWVSGFDPQISIAQLTQIFEKFGRIHKIDFKRKDINCAYIEYKTIDEAIEAVKNIRGSNFKYSSEHKLRIDYASDGISSDAYSNITAISRDLRETINERYTSSYNQSRNMSSYSTSNDKTEPERGKKNRRLDENDNNGSKHFKQNYFDFFQSSKTSSHHSSATDDLEPEEGFLFRGYLFPTLIVNNVVREFTNMLWQGIILSKNSQFPAQCYLISGNQCALKLAMTELEGNSVFEITQRLRFNKLLIDDLKYTTFLQGLFLFVPCSRSSINNANSSIQIRPLRDLVEYFNKKKAAGVIPLVEPKPNSKQIGMLLAYPPCEYSSKILLHLDSEKLITGIGNYMVVAIVTFKFKEVINLAI